MIEDNDTDTARSGLDTELTCISADIRECMEQGKSWLFRDLPDDESEK